MWAASCCGNKSDERPRLHRVENQPSTVSPPVLINKVFSRRRQCIIVAFNLEDTRPWFSLFIAIDCHQSSPLPPIDVSDHQMHVFARGGSARERVPLHCCSHFLEMKGSAQDALKAADHRAARISSYPRHPVLVAPCHIRASPDRSRHRARHGESSECYFGWHCLPSQPG